MERRRHPPRLLSLSFSLPLSLSISSPLCKEGDWPHPFLVLSGREAAISFRREGRGVERSPSVTALALALAVSVSLSLSLSLPLPLALSKEDVRGRALPVHRTRHSGAERTPPCLLSLSLSLSKDGGWPSPFHLEEDYMATPLPQRARRKETESERERDGWLPLRSSSSSALEG